jgi:type VI secretion system protein ImpG
VQSVDIVPFQGLRSPNARAGFWPAESDEPRRGYRLLIRLVANTAHNQDLHELSLHINHLDDLRSSLTVMHELKKHLRSASVLYDPSAPEHGAGQPCEVSFGAPDDESELPEAYESPLQRARARVRFPRRDLYLNVRGMSPPRNWQHITLCLDLAESWPRKLRLTSDGFELYSVPMINAVRAFANPVECDGTKDRYPLRHPDESGGFVPLWAIGAYRPTKSGFVPLEPGVVGTDGDSYEIVTEGKGEERRAFAMLQIAGAFTKPERISVELFWHQPGLSDTSSSELKVGLSERFVEGLIWSCSGPVLPDAETELDDDRDAQLELVSLKTLRFLGQDELLSLLRACGAHEEPLFAKLVGALDFVRVDTKPFGKRSHGLKYVYEIGFDTLDPSDVPRLGAFSRWLLDLLSTWSAEEVLELVTVVPNLEYRESLSRGL